jgi:NAD(P)-dependent dehydrogenase (short-subunit alcohol dehydrogenase family)
LKAELDGRVCAVTGAGRGIGAAIATRFASEGARIAILERDPAIGEETASRLAAEGAEARFYELDVSDETGVVEVAGRVVADFGRVDVLVNNAGIGRLGPSMSLPVADFRASLDVMVIGTFLCCREFGSAMRAGDGGAIVNISSINGLVAFPMRLAYSAAKAAVVSMTAVLASEWAAFGIRVNAVAPGNTRTEMVQEAVDQELIDLDAYMDHTPLRRLAEPAEIAEAVLYLASDRSSFITGQVIAADGGWTAFGWVPWSGDPDAPGVARESAGTDARRVVDKPFDRDV